MLASAPNLMALFVGLEAATSLMLADSRLGALGVAFSLGDGGGAARSTSTGARPCALEGAVVALAGPPGAPLVLRRVVGADEPVLAPDGARDGQAGVPHPTP